MLNRMAVKAGRQTAFANVSRGSVLECWLWDGNSWVGWWTAEREWQDSTDRPSIRGRQDRSIEYAERRPTFLDSDH
jgi:hypothetical protein